MKKKYNTSLIVYWKGMMAHEEGQIGSNEFTVSLPRLRYAKSWTELSVVHLNSRRVGELRVLAAFQ